MQSGRLLSTAVLFLCCGEEEEGRGIGNGGEGDGGGSDGAKK